VASVPQSFAAGTSTITSVPLSWAEPAATNGGTITDYQVQFRLLGSSTWSTFSDGVSTLTETTVTGLTRSKTYQFRVVALTNHGAGAYSATVSRATLSGVTSAPQSLAAGEAGSSSLSLTWEPPSLTNGGVITDYRVHYRRSGSTTWIIISDGVSSETGATLTGLRASTSYQVRVTSITAQGVSAYSATISASTTAVPLT
jgi:hypothetical protein